MCEGIECVMRDLRNGWYATDLVDAAKNCNLPKLREQDYDDIEDLIYDPRVVKYREIFKENWESNKKFAIIMDCSPVKPYFSSPSHMKVHSSIEKNGLEDKVQVYTASDPMGLVPYEHETKYPIYAYEMKSGFSDKAFDIMIDVFEEQFECIKNNHEYWITFIPAAKLGMVKGAMKRVGILSTDVPYGLYEDPPIKEMVDELERTGKCDIFNHSADWSITGVS